MSTESIHPADQEQVRLLFGAQDQNLRRLRDAIDVNIVFRSGEIKLDGEPEQVARGRQIIDELLAIVDRKGQLTEDDLDRVIGHVAVDTPDDRPDSIALHTRAKKVVPKTPGQSEYVRAIRQNDLVFCIGPAGCGKTYLAVAAAISALRQEKVRKIVLVRPAVEAGERLGFLPGDMLAKVNPYLRPLLDALNEMLDYEQVKRYMEADVVEIVPLAFMRGRTLNDTFIILDEAQNTTVTQMKMFLTRMGEGSQIVVTGDATQVDLPSAVASGLSDAIKRLAKIDGVGTVELTGRDIVRHRLVRDIVRCYDQGSSRPKRRR